MASEKPVITVVGSTSKQGYSVAKSLLATGDYTVRALTRNPDGEWAKRLAARGAVLVAGDAGSEADLRAAFAGAWGVFAMTFVHAVTGTQDAAIEEEYALGKLQADAAAAEGVSVFIFSTLEDVESRSKGKYKAPLFTAKARVQAYVLENHPRMTSVFPSFGMFYTNWVGSYPPTRAADGALVFTLPMDGSSRQPCIDPVRSPEQAVVELLREPQRYRGHFVPVYDELLTPDEMVETFTSVTGIKARSVRSTREEWFKLLSRLPGPTIEALIDVYQYQEEYGYYAPERNMKLARELYAEPSMYANFLQTSAFTGTQSLEDVRQKLDA